MLIQFRQQLRKCRNNEPNVDWLGPENTYQLLCRLSTTRMCFQELAQFNR